MIPSALRQNLKNSTLQLIFKQPRSCSRHQQTAVFSSTPPSSTNANGEKLYDTHIPTSPFHKFYLAVNAGFQALNDPGKTDMVATLAETTSILSLPHLRRKMLVDPVGRRILREKPIISSSTLPSSYLSSLPPNSFGYNYYHNFLLKYDVTPDSRSPVHFIDNEEEAYIMLRYRQIHDFWHTLTGVPVSVEGEVGLKVFELVQTGLPMTLLSSILGPLKLNSTEKKRFWNNYVPWAVKCGSSSMFLLNVYYEEILDKDLNQIRKELGIWVPPFLSEVGRDHDVILAGANQSAHEKDSLKVE